MEEQKRIPLLPAASTKAKPKKEPKTYCFQLELTEPSAKTYSSFSWLDLVHDNNEKATKAKLNSGVPLLNPYASDDEDDLQAMAARFEAKYSASGTSGKREKRKRRAEEFIDKGAGYDESDSFIDNSDIYDEVVPLDMQPAHGGFYINCGALDFKQVEVSEDEDESSVTVDGESTKNKIKLAAVKPGEGAIMNHNSERNHDHAEDIIQQVSKATKERKPNVDSIRPKLAQKRRASNSSSGSSSKTGPKRPKLSSSEGPKANGSKKQSLNQTQVQALINSAKSGRQSPNPIKNVATISISSSSEDSSADSSDEDSSSSTASSESTGKNKNAAIKKIVRLPEANKIKHHQSLPSLHPIPKANHLNPANMIAKNAGLPQKRLKVKNVPLNPKLHGQAPGGSNSNTPRHSPVPTNTMNPLTLNLNQNQPMHLKPLPPLSQQQNSPTPNSDLFISKVPAKDTFSQSQPNLLKPPRLTPAPSMSSVSPNANATKPKPVTIKKLTNRMSCGPPRSASAPRPQNIPKQRKSVGALPTAQSSFTSNIKSVITSQNNVYNAPNSKTSTASNLVPAQKKQPNAAKRTPVTVTQKTFNKIRKPKQKTPDKRLSNSATGEYIQRNLKHSISSANLLTPAITTNAQLIQQYQNQYQHQLFQLSQANSFQYPRQSPINTIASSQNVAAVIPSSKPKGVPNETKGRNSQSHVQTSRAPPTVIIKSTSGANSLKNSSNPPPPPMQQYALPMTLSSSLSLTSTSNSSAMSAGNNLKQQPYGKHITPFDVNSLLSNRKM